MELSYVITHMMKWNSLYINSAYEIRAIQIKKEKPSEQIIKYSGQHLKKIGYCVTASPLWKHSALDVRKLKETQPYKAQQVIRISRPTPGEFKNSRQSWGRWVGREPQELYLQAVPTAPGIQLWGVVIYAGWLFGNAVDLSHSYPW